MSGGINDFKFVLIMCLTIGLAPFFPAPHIIGKLQWVLGGGEGMKPMDIFDFLMHGTPWFLMIRLGMLEIYKKLKPVKTDNLNKLK